MAFIGDQLRSSLTEHLASLPRPVRLMLFTAGEACRVCPLQESLLHELAGLSEHLSLTVVDTTVEPEKAATHEVERTPTTLVLADAGARFRFSGVTGGHEFGSLVDAVLLAATGEAALPAGLNDLAALLDEPTHIEVMVTLTCPYCPGVVSFVHRLAMVNSLVSTDIVDMAEFPLVAETYRISGVPRIVVNGRPGFEGALDDTEAMLEILRLVKPGVVEQLEERVLEEAGERRVRHARADHLYDVAVVGAGPAAWSAAIYAVRKGLDALLIGERTGGQVTETADVENWLGIPHIEGVELARMFRRHAERHAFDEAIGARVARVTRAGSDFAIEAVDGRSWRTRTVVYAAGKTYRRLGLAREEEFLGRGIAFCATCDAPLYRGKRVAVVGGGNSAFTAARDLLPFADVVHVICARRDFQADPVLRREVEHNPHVRLHRRVRVTAYLGDDTLTGVRIASHDSEEEVPVDGVFLEIGLVPNADAVAALVQLNARGEVPVGRRQESTVSGLFAAGDVTDEPDKQIVVAAAAGAKAALAAADYLASSAPPPSMPPGHETPVPPSPQ